MQKAFDEVLGNVDDILKSKAFPVFDKRVIDFLNEVSGLLFSVKKAKEYKDLMAMAFFIRKSSLIKLKEKYDCVGRMGVGIAFHVTPSNIPVQFFHSLVVSLLSGNSNIIRMSNTRYPQTDILCMCIANALIKFPEIGDRICLVSYGHEKDTTTYFSQVCDVRIIWGGIIQLLRLDSPR